MNKRLVMRCLAVGTLMTASVPALGQTAPATGKSAAQQRAELALVSDLMGAYTVNGNITYKTVDGWDGKLDVYSPRGLKKANPTIVYYHGGGWQTGTKEERSLLLLPYLLKGWTVVNVEYRLRDQALAPAGAEDAYCALQWVFDHAASTFQSSTGPLPYLFDTSRIVTTGTSAGGHLALLVAMAPRSAGLGKDCPGKASGELKVAAVVDWFGISDVLDVYTPGSKSLGGGWVGDQPNPQRILRQVSPSSYVSRTVPPIISIHGDSDTVVPYAQKVRFHEALAKLGADHELITIEGGGHGIFKPEASLNAYEAVWKFLAAHDILPSR
jgi:acetyl esterase/lipase